MWRLLYLTIIYLYILYVHLFPPPLSLQTLLAMTVPALVAAGELTQAVQLSEEQCQDLGHRLPQATLDELKLACASSQPQLLDRIKVS